MGCEAQGRFPSDISAPLPGQTWRQCLKSEERAHRIAEQRERRRLFPKWLAEQGWEWFVTFTFRKRYGRHDTKLWHTEHDEARREERFYGKKPGKLMARKLLLRAINTLNRKLFGKRYATRGEGLTMVLAWEPHQDGTAHAHALARGIPELKREEWTFFRLNDFFWQRIGMSRWFPIESDDEKRARYVAKYVTKSGNEDEWEIIGPTQKNPTLFEPSPGTPKKRRAEKAVRE